MPRINSGEVWLSGVSVRLSRLLYHYCNRMILSSGYENIWDSSYDTGRLLDMVQ